MLPGFHNLGGIVLPSLKILRQGCLLIMTHDRGVIIFISFLYKGCIISFNFIWLIISVFLGIGGEAIGVGWMIRLIRWRIELWD